MSYASAWCVRTTSSTTYSMVGSLNKLPIAISGIVFFGDPATFTNVTAIMIGKPFYFFSLLHFTLVYSLFLFLLIITWLCYICISLWKYKIGFSAGLVYSYAKAFPSKSSELKVSSASSQSYSDATKYDEKKDRLW